MCTIRAVKRGNKTFLLKNLDADQNSFGWALFDVFCPKNYPHCGLVGHTQQGVNSGLNSAGLGLVIAISRDPFLIYEKEEELRTVLNAALLAGHANVKSALAEIKRFSRTHRWMTGGNALLADKRRIAVVEHFGRKARSKSTTEGFFFRANHSVFGVVDNAYADDDSVARHQVMNDFLKKLYKDMPRLNREDIRKQCKAMLREKPVLNRRTRGSMVIDIESGRVDYCIGKTAWRTFQW